MRTFYLRRPVDEQIVYAMCGGLYHYAASSFTIAMAGKAGNLSHHPRYYMSGGGNVRSQVMNPVSDEAVMLEVREGQVGRLAVLFERHHRSLFNYFCRQTGNREQSEDLTQEVFMRILKYRKSFQPRTSFAAWMFQVARHAHIDTARKRRGERAWDQNQTEPASPESPADESIGRTQEVALIRKALTALPPDKREVLVLSRYHDLRYEEIGQVLGCEAGAVKVRVYRAMQALRRTFAEMAGEPK